MISGRRILDEVVMKAKLINELGEKTYALVFDKGDEVIDGLLSFARKEKVQASHFSAIGALSDVTLGYFNWAKKTFDKISIQEQVEVLSLVGNIVFDNGNPKLHAHIVIGKSDGTAHGGHLVEAHVRPILEVILVESPSHLHRKMDKETGLTLITFEPD
jgi:predicted DNA-binding protein with PD1-like motif